MFGFFLLDYFTISWNFLFYFFFLSLVPFIFFRTLTLIYLKTDNQNTNADTIKLIKYSIIVLITILIALLTLWTSPELFMFNNQILIGNNSITIMKLITIAALFTTHTYGSLNKQTLFYFTLILTIYLTLSLLTVSQSLYTLIFILEFTNLLIFGLLILNNLAVFFRNTKLDSKILNAIFLFFWINAFSALLLFMFLFLTIANNPEFEFNAITLIDLFSKPLPLYTLKINLLTILPNFFIVDSEFFIYFIFLTSFIFKLGLPPFIFWKISLFNNSPVQFIYTYSVLYTTAVFFTFFYVLAGLFNGTLTDEFIYITTLTVLTAIIFATLILSESVSTVGVFFALSSSYTFILLFYFFFVNNYTLINLLQTPSVHFEFIKIYILFYIAALSLLILTMRDRFNILGQKPLTSFITNNQPKINKITARLTLSVIFFSLAGLPPFPSFFIKLNFLTLINSIVLTNTINFSVFYLFIFGQLIFYFRTVRFFFTTPDSLNVNITKYYSESTTFNLNNNSLLLIFILTGFVFTLNDLILLLFV